MNVHVHVYIQIVLFQNLASIPHILVSLTVREMGLYFFPELFPSINVDGTQTFHLVHIPWY